MQKNWDRYIDHVSAVAVKEATVEEARRRRRSDCL